MTASVVQVADERAAAAAVGAEEAARQAWSLRVERVGSVIQAALAGWWLARGVEASGWPDRALVAGVLAGLAVGTAMVGALETRGRGRRPSGPTARRLEREVTVATVVQLVASVALPVALEWADRPTAVLPVVAVTVGVLFLWFRRRLGVPRSGVVGAALVVGPPVVWWTCSGPTVTVVTGLGCGVLLAAAGLIGLVATARQEPSGRLPRRTDGRRTDGRRTDGRRTDGQRTDGQGGTMDQATRGDRQAPAMAGGSTGDGSPHYLAPGWFARRFNTVVRGLTRRGLSVWGSRVLEVRGRRSGEVRRTVVNVLTIGERRYLVAPRGNAEWVRNLRAAGGDLSLSVGRRQERCTASELADEVKPEILRAYLARWKFEVGVFFEGVDERSPAEELARISLRHPVLVLEAAAS